MRSPVPDPAVVVLVGAAGSGKSTWAAERYAPAEIVSSDALRAVVGTGPADLEATGEAFALLDQIVASRTRRRLTTVIDTLGLDLQRRLAYLGRARSAQLAAVAVVLDTPAQLCRQRNAARDRPVPADALSRQLRGVRAAITDLETEGWDQVLVVATETEATGTPAVAPAAPPGHQPADGSAAGALQINLQLSRFPWGQDPAGWLRSVTLRASEVGFDGVALMDHLIQIPQVGRAWDPLPEPWVTLGMLAGLDTRLRLGTLVSPITFRAPGIVAKMVATLDVLTGGRAFCGIGAGWWEREHAAYGLPFPPARERLDRLEQTIETLRALWGAGTKAYEGPRVQLPETTCYPRPLSRIPIIVGGSGERRTLGIAARLGDGCNLPAADEGVLVHKLEVLHRHCAAAGRDPGDVAVTVLDVPVLGHDREDVARRVERLRGRTSAASFAARHHAGTAVDQVVRYRRLRGLGVSTVFVGVADLDEPGDLDRFAPLLATLRSG